MKVFNEKMNVAVLTTKFVMKDREGIHNVFHHEDDGLWEFTGPTQGVEDSDYMVVGLEEIIALDPSVQEVSDLELGEKAYRPSEEIPWTRYY